MMTEVQRNMKAIIKVVTIEEKKEIKDREKKMIKKKNLQQHKRRKRKTIAV
jgi:hypothetical protein